MITVSNYLNFGYTSKHLNLYKIFFCIMSFNFIQVCLLCTFKIERYNYSFETKLNVNIYVCLCIRPIKECCNLEKG